MTRALLITTLVTSAAIAAFTIASAGQVPATTGAPPAFQSGWQQAFKTIGAGVQGQGYMMLAGAKVRDHRNNQGGSANTSNYGYNTRGGGKGKLAAPPPPLADRKMRNPLYDIYIPDSSGGVTVNPRGGIRPWKYPCYGSSC